MGVLTPEWNDRIEYWIRTLREDFYEELGEIPFEVSRTFDLLSPEEAAGREFMPAFPGYTWGESFEYAWFRGRIILPEKARGERIVLNLQPGHESTLFVNGEPFGCYRDSWVTKPHHYIEDNDITRCGVPGETYEILMEVCAGHDFPGMPYDSTGPVLPGKYQDLNTSDHRVTLGRSTYGIWREDAYQLYMDVMTLRLLLNAVDENSLRAQEVAQALRRFTLAVDFEQDGDRRLADYRKAREILRPALEAKNGTTMPLFWAVGNSHIDLAWKWPVSETIRKTARTFAAQLRHLEEYPDYVYVQSQPAEYELCRQHYPGLFEKIKKAIADGRWIADGAMYVEPDTNISSGESLIRQLIYGKEYYREVLGTDSHVLWLPDTFGYSGALPQILCGCDVQYLVTQKIFWSYNGGERFPYHYFTWEGIDGSKITSFMPTSYIYTCEPDEITRTWNDRSQRTDLDTFLMPYGYGDGGGGASRDHIEFIKREKDLQGIPRTRQGSVLDFFRYMEEKGGPCHTYHGELYLTAHRGTYTSQAAIKKHNRLSENLLREAEFVLSMRLCGAVQDTRGSRKRELDELWKTLLFNQFHDILPGSSIRKVYEDAEEAHISLRRKAAALLEEEARMQTGQQEGTSAGTQAITVWSFLSFGHFEDILLPLSMTDFASGAVNADGESFAAFVREDKILIRVYLPGCGRFTFRGAGGEAYGIRRHEAYAYRESDMFVLENDLVRAEVNSLGQVCSYRLKESGQPGRELAAAPMNVWHLYKDVPRNFDAWDIDSNYRLSEDGSAANVSVEIIADGTPEHGEAQEAADRPMIADARLMVRGTIKSSFFAQEIILREGSARLDFRTQIDWKERHRLLKAAFPVTLRTDRVRNEIQFGYIERPNHRSTQSEKERFEVCNYRYSAFVTENAGAAILNDCKYGMSAEDNALELTLLRGPVAPDLEGDLGLHEFTYSFYGWNGSFTEAGPVREAYLLNHTPVWIPGTCEDIRLLEIGKTNIFLDGVKPARDESGDLILRLYEAAGTSVTTDISFGIPVSSLYICNMLEENLTQLPLDAEGTIHLRFEPFEIRTLRVKGGH